jgi:hypothetical protein
VAEWRLLRPERAQCPLERTGPNFEYFFCFQPLVDSILKHIRITRSNSGGGGRVFDGVAHRGSGGAGQAKGVARALSAEDRGLYWARMQKTVQCQVARSV